MRVKTLSLSFPFVSSREFSQKRSILLNVLKILFVLSIIFLAILYIFQVNNEVSQRYSIRDSQKRIEELKSQIKELEIASAQNNSLESILSLIESLGFERTERVGYIRVLNNQVVAK